MALEVKTYRKTATVEAGLYTGDNVEDVLEWAEGHTTFAFGKLWIHTLEGDVTVVPGCYVLKGVHGEFWPCDGEIFGKTYEEDTDA